MRKKQTDLFDYLNRAFMERSRWEIDYGNVNFTAFYDKNVIGLFYDFLKMKKQFSMVLKDDNLCGGFF